MAVKKRGRVWVADFWIGGRNGQRVRRKAPTQELAKAFEREAKAREFCGDVLDVVRERIPLAVLIEHYENLHENGNTPSTRLRNQIVFRNLKENLGNPTIQEITERDLEGYKAARLRKVKPGTVNLELRVIRSVFNRAVDWGYLRKSPASRVRAVRLDQKEPKFLTVDEGRRLIQSADGSMRTFIVVALHTGLRRGELLGLKWADISFESLEVRVRKSKGRRFRVIPLNVVVEKALRIHPRHISSPYVFCGTKGKPWVDVRYPFHKALERAELPRIRVHDLRHSFVSNLVMAGVDLRAVQELAGHRSIATTMRYAHLQPGRLRDSVELLAV